LRFGRGAAIKRKLKDHIVWTDVTWRFTPSLS
jgi:hypothetical protein